MKYLIVILTLTLFLIGGIFLPRDFRADEEVIFKVERGDGSREIALNLEKEGLVWWSPLFRLYVLAAGKGHKLQAGDYLLSPSMNMPKIAGKLASGDIATARITIPEGFTSTQISAKLQNVTRSVLVTLNDYEGYLFPDKYNNRGQALFILGDGSKGYEKEAPYDKILCSAAVQQQIPEAWKEQLKIGGRLVAPVQSSIWLLAKESETDFEETEFPGFAFVPLIEK